MLTRGFLAVACVAVSASAAHALTLFDQTDLVTDNQQALAAEGFAPAQFVDPNLINPWGMSSSATSPLWVSNQGTGTATLYNGQGQAFPLAAPLTVSIPQSPAQPAGPTGQVSNTTSSFVLSSGGKTGPANFIFANLDGSISAWNGTGTPSQAVQVVAPSSATRPATYTGIAIASTAQGDFLYAANGRTGQIDVFDKNFAPVTLPGHFTDTGANPAGLVPFNVRTINNQIYVTYAPPGRTADQAPLGTGFVNVFDTSGNIIKRLTTGGSLASPWGLALAPAGFGEFSNALLVGNFNGQHGNINAFDLASGAFLGSLRNPDGSLISLPDLWALQDGNGGNGGAPRCSSPPASATRCMACSGRCTPCRNPPACCCSAPPWCSAAPCGVGVAARDRSRPSLRASPTDRRGWQGGAAPVSV